MEKNNHTTKTPNLCVCVCVGGPNTWWYTKSHAKGSSRYCLLLVYPVCY